MRFVEVPLAGVYVIDLEPIEDDRGFFSRTYCGDEFAAFGLNTEWPQENLSYNTYRHTLRGMHFNRGDHAEERVVYCTTGAIYDVVIDLRPGSTSRFEWFGTELTASNRTAIFIPKGFAHGFLTLTSNTEVRYRMGARYEPTAAAGIRWDDPMVRVEWPAAPDMINDRDAQYPDLSERMEEIS